jgi:membrane protein required for colicin V production
MNLVDILIWLVLAGFVVKGFMKGLIRQVCSLLGFLVGGWAALKYHLYLVETSRHIIHLPPNVASILSFVFIFLVVGLLFFLLGHLLTVIFNIILLGGVNRVGGVVLGFLEGAFILSLLLYFGTGKALPEKFRGHLLSSKTAEPFIATGREIVAGWSGLSPALKEPLKQKNSPAPGKRKE